MHPLHIDFAPLRPTAPRMRWIAGSASVLMLVAASAIWLIPPQAEAGHMVEAVVQPLPNTEEMLATDAAVRRLNFPWIEALAALEAACADPTQARLENITSNLAHGSLRVTGTVRSSELAQALPERLVASQSIAAADLQSQETASGMTSLPVRFVMELQLRDPS